MSLLATMLIAIAQQAKAQFGRGEATSTTSLPLSRPSWFGKIEIDVLGLLGSVMISLFWCRFGKQHFSLVESYDLFGSMSYMLPVNIATSSIMLAAWKLFPQTISLLGIWKVASSWETERDWANQLLPLITIVTAERRPSMASRGFWFGAGL